MNEEIMNKLNESVFGTNKYYVEIIKSFISEYPKENIRTVINQDNVYLKVTDLSGSKNISFKLDDNGHLRIKVDKTIDFRKYQEIIIYDEYGVMLKRIRSNAVLKKDINEKFEGNQEVLLSEFAEIGEKQTIYTGSIFESIDLVKVERPDNFGLDGLYTHKKLQYDAEGKLNGHELQGTFKVLESGSIFSLKIPDENNILVTKEQLLVDNHEYTYREPISFKK